MAEIRPMTGVHSDAIAKANDRGMATSATTEPGAQFSIMSNPIDFDPSSTGLKSSSAGFYSSGGASGFYSSGGASGFSSPPSLYHSMWLSSVTSLSFDI